MLKNDASYFELANFILSLMTIQHSNCFIERIFSQVNPIKNYQRNLLNVSSVDSILKIKSYYSEDTKSDSKLLFEPQEKDYHY